MAATLACIAEEEIHRQWDAGLLKGQALGRRATPYGDSGDIFRAGNDETAFYLLARCGSGMDRIAPHRVNARANLYALKDLGVHCILGWGPGAAITHNIAEGDLVILSDLIDQTHLRPRTFFEDSPLGELRQFPVFCEELRRRLAGALEGLKLVYHATGTAAVREGPRLETPAEVRMLSMLGAEIVTHTFAPEAFLARELQMGYAAVCYVTSYAERGSRHQPFAAGELFKDLGYAAEADRRGAAEALGRIAAQLAGGLAELDLKTYPPAASQTDHVGQYNLPADWREWFEHR
ncbi:MAG: MTAP family purine nucleoside phosphorylase [Phycisphaerae bacterium]|nr:MTAP family purine nucleoside phosphorylase [Phycisphaerae bacterium]